MTISVSWKTQLVLHSSSLCLTLTWMCPGVTVWDASEQVTSIFICSSMSVCPFLKYSSTHRRLLVSAAFLHSCSKEKVYFEEISRVLTKPWAFWYLLFHPFPVSKRIPRLIIWEIAKLELVRPIVESLLAQE